MSNFDLLLLSCLLGLFPYVYSPSSYMDTLGPPPDGDVTKGTSFIIIVAVLGFFSTTTTVLRLGVRIANRQQGWDDLTIALAMVITWIQAVFDVLQYRAGIGRHAYYLSSTQAIDAIKWGYVETMLFFITVGLTKISICLFILRIKKTGWLKWVLYALMTGIMMTTAAPEIIMFVQCRPMRAFWDRKSGKCWDQTIYNAVIFVHFGMPPASNCFYARLTL